MLSFEVLVVEVSDDESGYRSRSPKPGRDVVTVDDIRLFVGWEGKDENPSCEDVRERVHLNEAINSLLTNGSKKRRREWQH